MTTAQDGGKFVSLTYRPHFPPGNAPGTHFCQRLSRQRAVVRSEGYYVNEKSTDTSWDRTSELPICGTAP